MIYYLRGIDCKTVLQSVWKRLIHMRTAVDINLFTGNVGRFF